MPRFRAIFLACAVSLLALPGHGRAAERVALVIGNSAYTALPRLPNPANDAQDIARSFERLGFGVTVLQDASFEQFRRALLTFGNAAAGADIAIVYYAGHGIEVAGENWLLPVDGRLRDDSDVGTEGVSLRNAMLAVAEAKTLGLIILDACRNDPFEKIRKVASATRSITRGLAPIDPAENVLVAYAARDGTTARDGDGRNSPYTTALLRHLETPGLELEFLFRNVRDDVWSATSGTQQPFLYGSLSKDEIYLNNAPRPDAASVVADTTAPATDPATETTQAAEIAWSFVQATSDVDTLRRFTDRFPASNQVGLARQRIAALESSATQSDAPPPGMFALASADSVVLQEQEAKLSRPFRKNTPAVELAWNVVKDSKDVNVVRRFTDHFPSARRRAEATARMNQFVLAPAAMPRGNFAPGSNPPGGNLMSRDVMLQAAQDYDVVQCFMVDDIASPACRNAIERYPFISRFTYDYRFRFTLCQSLGDACGGRRDILTNSANLQSKALFHPQNMDVTKASTTPAAASPFIGGPISPGGPLPPGGPIPGPPPPGGPGIGAPGIGAPGAGTPVIGAPGAPIRAIPGGQGTTGIKPLMRSNFGFRSFRAAVQARLNAKAITVGGTRFGIIKTGTVLTPRSGVSALGPRVNTIKVLSTPTARFTTTPSVKLPTTSTPIVRTPTISVMRTPTISVMRTPTISVVRTPTISVVRTPAISTIRTPAISAIRTPTIVTPTVRTPTVRTPVVRTPSVNLRVPAVRLP